VGVYIVIRDQDLEHVLETGAAKTLPIREISTLHPASTQGVISKENVLHAIKKYQPKSTEYLGLQTHVDTSGYLITSPYVAQPGWGDNRDDIWVPQSTLGQTWRVPPIYQFTAGFRDYPLKERLEILNNLYYQIYGDTEPYVPGRLFFISKHEDVRVLLLSATRGSAVPLNYLLGFPILNEAATGRKKAKYANKAAILEYVAKFVLKYLPEINVNIVDSNIFTALAPAKPKIVRVLKYTTFLDVSKVLYTPNQNRDMLGSFYFPISDISYTLELQPKFEPVLRRSNKGELYVSAGRYELKATFVQKALHLVYTAEISTSKVTIGTVI